MRISIASSLIADKAVFRELKNISTSFSGNKTWLPSQQPSLSPLVTQKSSRCCPADCGSQLASGVGESWRRSLPQPTAAAEP